MLFLRYRISVLRNADLNGMSARFVTFLENTFGIWVENAAYEMAFYVRKPMWNHFVPRQKCDMEKGPFFYARKEFKTVTATTTNNSSNSQNHFYPKTTFVHFFSSSRYKLSNVLNIPFCRKCQEFMRKYQMFSFCFFPLVFTPKRKPGRTLIFVCISVCVFRGTAKHWNSISRCLPSFKFK